MQHMGHFFLRKFISMKRALVLDRRFPRFNNLKRILSLMKSMIPPPLAFIFNLNGFAKLEIRNCSQNVSSLILSLTLRKDIFRLLFKKLAFQICFLLN